MNDGVNFSSKYVYVAPQLVHVFSIL